MPLGIGDNITIVTFFRAVLGSGVRDLGGKMDLFSDSVDLFRIHYFLKVGFGMGFHGKKKKIRGFLLFAGLKLKTLVEGIRRKALKNWEKFETSNLINLKIHLKQVLRPNDIIPI